MSSETIQKDLEIGWQMARQAQIFLNVAIDLAEKCGADVEALVAEKAKSWSESDGALARHALLKMVQELGAKKRDAQSA